MFLTNLSLKRPVLATVIILALVALGLLSYFSLSINHWPDLEFPYVAVTIVQPGASPEQMETKVAQKVEEAIGQISGVKHIYTTTQEGVATVMAEFTLETKALSAAQDVRDKLGTIRGELPQDVEEPVISRFDPTSAPIITLAVTGSQSVRELSTLVDDQIKKRLDTIGGVGAVNIKGDEEREIQILLDKEKLAAYGLSPAEIVANLQAENLEVPGGSLSGEGRRITLRTASEVAQVSEFHQLPVARRGDTVFRLADVAEVVDGVKEKESVARYQGRPAIGIEIVKQSGTNTVVVTDAVKHALTEIRSQLPAGVDIELVRDNSVIIRSSVNHVVATLIEGGLLAVLTVFFFLRNWRSTLISALAIPSSIITTFFAMKLLGYSLNIMSLMALSLSVGLLIDDAIVVIENIVRHLQLGKSPLAAASEGAAEIGLAVTATTLTVVAVFAPVGLITGMIGQFFRQFGITVVVAVLISLLFAFTLVPLLSARTLSREETRIRGPVGFALDQFNRGYEWFARQYTRLLALVLRRRWQTLLLAGLLFVSSIMITPLLGSGFVPSGDLSEISLDAVLDSGLSLDAAQIRTDQLEAVISSYPEVEKMYTSTGTDNIHVYLKLVEKLGRSRSDREIAAALRNQLKDIPGMKVSMLFNDGVVEQKTWEFRLLGNNLDEMQVYSEQLQHLLSSVPGAVDITSSLSPGKPEIQLQVKNDQAADLGVSTGLIADTIYTLFNGKVVSKYKEGDEQYDVRVRLAGDQRQNIQDLNRIFLPSSQDTPAGQPRPQIALSQVTDAIFATTPAQIKRFDRSREILLSGNLDGVSVGDFNQQFMKRLATELPPPAGFRVVAGGDAERMAEAYDSMGLAFLIGVLFIFFILAAQFESYIDPLAIMLSLPLAIVGAILGLLLMDSEINLISMIGIIMLMGLVTKNAILLIDFTKQARTQGMERNAALIQAAAVRLRPILMTSTAMILGMVPLALAIGGAGAEQRAPMAHAIIGGLITSTLLTLVVVPVIYTLLDDVKSFFKKRTLI